MIRLYYDRTKRKKQEKNRLRIHFLLPFQEVFKNVSVHTRILYKIVIIAGYTKDASERKYFIIFLLFFTPQFNWQDARGRTPRAFCCFAAACAIIDISKKNRYNKAI